MQQIVPPEDSEFKFVIAALQQERVYYYLGMAKGDPAGALRLYLWNLELSEGFHLVLHTVEIACRNALNNALIKRFGPTWFEDTTFQRVLDPHYVDELARVIEAEARQHQASLTCHHLVSALSFGFWEHLTTKRFERLLWAKGVSHVFHDAPSRVTREEIRELIETARRWRNRIAHHRSIIAKGPTRKHNEALRLLGYVCSTTASWVQRNSAVPSIVGRRPT